MCRSHRDTSVVDTSVDRTGGVSCSSQERLPLRVAQRAVLVGAMILSVGLSLSAGMAEACPTCKDGIAASDAAEAASIARGYALSILIMLAMPFTLAGCFGLYVWREMRRLEREKVFDTDGPSPTFDQPTPTVPPGGSDASCNPPTMTS